MSIEVEKSCGNVFEDLGLPNAQELFDKSRAFYYVCEKVKKNSDNVMISNRLGISLERVDDIIQEKFRKFTLAELIDFQCILESE